MAKHPVIQLLRDADRGRLISDMQEGISSIVDAIEANRGSGTGKLTLTITIKSKSEGAYTLTPSLNVKVPEPARQDMITFLDEQSGELQRRDPRQPDLPMVVEADFRNRTGGAADE